MPKASHNEHQIHTGHRLGWKGPTERPVLNFANYFVGVIPQVPATADNMAQVTTWNGQTNKHFGTCGPCSYANLIIMAYKYLTGEDISVSDDAIYAFYRASGNPDFNPATGAGDNGVDNSIMLAAAQRVGLEVTHANGNTEFIKAVAYGRVSTTDKDSLHAATALFGGAIIGVELDIAQQSQTRATPAIWSYTPGSGIWGGHDIFGGKYTSAIGKGMPDEQVISWLKPVAMDSTFEDAQIQEIFVVLLPVMLLYRPILAGIDWPALAADYEQLTGRPFPVPIPNIPEPVPPQPEPAPTPTPEAADMVLNDAFQRWQQAKGLA